VLSSIAANVAGIRTSGVSEPSRELPALTVDSVKKRLNDQWDFTCLFLDFTKWTVWSCDVIVSLVTVTTWPHLRCDVGMEWKKGNINRTHLCYIIVYYYNGATRYEQLLRVVRLNRALILLGLALCLLSWAWWDWSLTWLTNHCP